MEKKNDNTYHVKYQKKLIEKVLSTQFKSIKDLIDFINSEEESKITNLSEKVTNNNAPLNNLTNTYIISN